MLDFNNLSYWEKETYINHTDYLIIGSGIVGLSTAIHLKERNPSKKVTVLERGYLPTGASTKNAGFSCIGSPSELLDDLKNNSADSVFATVKKRWEGLLYLRQLLGDEAIGYKSYGSYELFKATDAHSFEECIEQLPYLNSILTDITGISEVFKQNSEITNTAKFQGFPHAITHAAEGQIDTGKMLQSLLTYALKKGVQVLNGIEAKKINQHQLITNYGAITFKQLAICTNGFGKELLPSEDVTPARAQVIVTSPIENLPFKGIFHFDKGYYYFRNIGNRVLFGGGRNLDFTGENTSNISNTKLITAELERLLREQILPESSFTIEHTWAGIMGVGASKSPLVKKIKPSIYCGMRLGGMGVAIGTLIGKELAELINAEH